MDQQTHAHQDVPPPSQTNDLPEAKDATTEKIHSMSNFSVSEAVGLPLLTKDVGKTPRERTSGSAADHLGSYFGDFDPRDRLMAAVSAVMILGPLFFGMMRG